MDLHCELYKVLSYYLAVNYNLRDTKEYFH